MVDLDNFLRLDLQKHGEPPVSCEICVKAEAREMAVVWIWSRIDPVRAF